MKKINTIIGAGIISMAVALSPALAQMNSAPGSAATPSGSGTMVQPKADEKAPVPGSVSKDEKNLPAKPGNDVKREGKDKDTAVKPGTESRNETAPAKPGPDVKAPASPAKPGAAMPSGPAAGVKSETKDKDTAAKPGENRTETLPAKPGTDSKVVTPPAAPGAGVKSESGVKNESRDKDSAAKTGTETKSDSLPSKSGSEVKSGTDMKSGAVSGKSDAGVKEEKSATVKPGSEMKNNKNDDSVKAQTKSSDKLTQPVKSEKDAVKAEGTVDHKHVKPKDADQKSGSNNPVKSSTGN